MAYSVVTTVLATNTLASYKAWAKPISDWFTTIGWVKETSVSGQIDWNTVTLPGASDDTRFEVWKTNDGKPPIFLRIAYGGNASSFPVIWFRAGSQVDALGVPSGTFRMSAQFIMVINTGSTSIPYTMLLQGNGSQVGIALQIDNPNSQPNGTTMFVERSRDDTGAYTSDGFYAFLSQNQNTQYVPFTAAPLVNIQPVAALPANFATSMSMANQAPVSPFYFFRGQAMPPPISALCYNLADFAINTNNTIEVFGVPRSFMMLGSHGNMASTSNWRIAFLAE